MTKATRDDVGTACVFFDTRGRAYPALITNVFGPQCVNVVYVNDVEGQKDAYGQKLIRASSVIHGSMQQAHGYFWLKVGEDRPAHTMPGFYASPEARERARENDSAIAD